MNIRTEKGVAPITPDATDDGQVEKKQRGKAEQKCNEKLISRSDLVRLLGRLKGTLDNTNVGPETSWDGASFLGFLRRGNVPFAHSEHQVIFGRTYTSGLRDPLEKPKRIFSGLLEKLANLVEHEASLEEMKSEIDKLKKSYPKLNVDLFIEQIKFFKLLKEAVFLRDMSTKHTISLICRIVRGSALDVEYFEDLLNE